MVAPYGWGLAAEIGLEDAAFVEVFVMPSASASTVGAGRAAGASTPKLGAPVAPDVRGPARAPEAAGEHHEHEDAANHTYRPAGFGWRLLRPGALVLGDGIPGTQSHVTNSGR